MNIPMKNSFDSLNTNLSTMEINIRQAKADLAKAKEKYDARTGLISRVVLLLSRR